eukprot:m.445383 g.445383  ORF g.445383 m.445383 type:complete len:476 (+) comp20303_c0_seq1:434-1861(+)
MATASDDRVVLQTVQNSTGQEAPIIMRVLRRVFVRHNLRYDVHADSVLIEQELRRNDRCVVDVPTAAFVPLTHHGEPVTLKRLVGLVGGGVSDGFSGWVTFMGATPPRRLDLDGIEELEDMQAIVTRKRSVSTSRSRDGYPHPAGRKVVETACRRLRCGDFLPKLGGCTRRSVALTFGNGVLALPRHGDHHDALQAPRFYCFDCDCDLRDLRDRTRYSVLMQDGEETFVAPNDPLVSHVVVHPTTGQLAELPWKAFHQHLEDNGGRFDPESFMVRGQLAMAPLLRALSSLDTDRKRAYAATVVGKLYLQRLCKGACRRQPGMLQVGGDSALARLNLMGVPREATVNVLDCEGSPRSSPWADLYQAQVDGRPVSVLWANGPGPLMAVVDRVGVFEVGSKGFDSRLGKHGEEIRFDACVYATVPRHPCLGADATRQLNKLFETFELGEAAARDVDETALHETFGALVLWGLHGLGAF